MITSSARCQDDRRSCWIRVPGNASSRLPPTSVAETGSASRRLCSTHRRGRTGHRGAQRHPRHIDERHPRHINGIPRHSQRVPRHVEFRKRIRTLGPKTKDQRPKTKDQRPETGLDRTPRQFTSIIIKVLPFRLRAGRLNAGRTSVPGARPTLFAAWPRVVRPSRPKRKAPPRYDGRCLI